MPVSVSHKDESIRLSPVLREPEIGDSMAPSPPSQSRAPFSLLCWTAHEQLSPLRAEAGAVGTRGVWGTRM